MSGTGYGPSAVGWPDIDAFCRLTRTGFTPWEIGLIEALDEAYLSARDTTEAAPQATDE